jgi:hypothetical protein
MQTLRTGLDGDTKPAGQTEDTAMSATWGRVLIGLAVAMCLLGVGVLEVLSERAPSARVSSTPPRPAVERWEPSWEAGDADGAQAAGAELSAPGAAGGLTASVQQRRLTVLEVNERARRLVSVNGAGRVLVTDLGRDPYVVTADHGAGSLALLQPGDVVRVDPLNGQARLIVVLRHAWQEAESPEK